MALSIDNPYQLEYGNYICLYNLLASQAQRALTERTYNTKEQRRSTDK